MEKRNYIRCELINQYKKLVLVLSRFCNFIGLAIMVYELLYNNQINARALIGQSAVGYCAGKPTEKLRVF